MASQLPTDGGVYVSKAAGWDDDGWTSVPNRAIRDVELSWEAKGALAWLASHRQTFRITADDLAKDGPKGRENARGMIRELEAKGWLTRHKVRDERTNRIVRHDWTLHPIPVAEDQRTTPPPHPTKKKRDGDAGPVPSGLGTGPEQGILGEDEPIGSPENARSGPVPSEPGTGRPVTGGPVTGAPVALEKNTENTRKIPQTPGKPGAVAAPPIEEPARCEHGRTACRECGTNPRAVAAAAEAEHQAEARAQAQREREERAVARQAEIEACDLCDDAGYAGTRVCHHQPELLTAGADARAQIRQALAARGRRHAPADQHGGAAAAS